MMWGQAPQIFFLEPPTIDGEFSLSDGVIYDVRREPGRAVEQRRRSDVFSDVSSTVSAIRRLRQQDAGRHHHRRT